MSELKKPQYIKVQLIFDEDALNQTMLIDCRQASKITVENEPIFKRSVITGDFDYNTILANAYIIIVEYPEGGINVKELQKD